MKRLLSLPALTLFTLVSMFGSNLASAATQTGNYSQGFASWSSTPDATGSGSGTTASAAYDAAAGTLSVAVRATSDAPIGVVYTNVGASDASAGAYINHDFGAIGGGPHTLSVSLNVDALSAPSATSNGNPILYGYDSTAFAGLYAGYGVTWTESGACSATYTCEYKSFASSQAITTTGQQFPIALTFDVPRAGTVVISVYLSAAARSSGNEASASASATATLLSATLN